MDVDRHPCASTWVRMVIIAPSELGQGGSGRRHKKSAQGKCAIRFELGTITETISDKLKH